MQPYIDEPMARSFSHTTNWDATEDFVRKFCESVAAKHQIKTNTIYLKPNTRMRFGFGATVKNKPWPNRLDSGLNLWYLDSNKRAIL